MKNKNPFRQPATLYQLRFEAPRESVPALEILFETGALAVSSFERTDDAATWRVEILSGTLPSGDEIAARLARLRQATGAAVEFPSIETVAEIDWVGAVQKDFPPLEVGRYFVHGSHVAPKKGMRSLRVDAGAAFGSGEHATTRLCLLALDRLARRKKFAGALDMGCGSAILALAIAKTWASMKRPVIAADIDAVSVHVARGNIRDNRLHTRLRAYAGDGYRTREIRQGAPYDLIVANILARPLVRMSGQLAAHLAPGGVAVLSGLLARQERMVLGAHRARGLVLKARLARAGWHTLILEKAKKGE